MPGWIRDKNTPDMPSVEAMEASLPEHPLDHQEYAARGKTWPASKGLGLQTAGDQIKTPSPVSQGGRLSSLKYVNDLSDVRI